MKIKKPAIADTGTGNQALKHRAYEPKGKHDPDKRPAQAKSVKEPKPAEMPKLPDWAKRK